MKMKMKTNPRKITSFSLTPHIRVLSTVQHNTIIKLSDYGWYVSVWKGEERFK